LKKEIEEDPRRWRDHPCLWTGRINIMKNVILLQAICRLNTIPIRIPMSFLTETEKSILKFIRKNNIP
jgi:hypothetical protein